MKSLEVPSRKYRLNESEKKNKIGGHSSFIYIHTSSVLCYYEHKKNFDIHSSMKPFPWRMCRLFRWLLCIKKRIFHSRNGTILIKYKYEDWIRWARFAHYEINTWTLCHSYLNEKQTSRIQSLNKVNYTPRYVGLPIAIPSVKPTRLMLMSRRPWSLIFTLNKTSSSLKTWYFNVDSLCILKRGMVMIFCKHRFFCDLISSLKYHFNVIWISNFTL